MFVSLLSSSNRAGAPEKALQIKLSQPLELGRKESFFASIASICEDNQSNFYVLDRLEYTVLKFSPDGRLLQKIGQKGQGPGDFQSPAQVVFTAERELAVLEDSSYVSFLKTNGVFIRRLDLAGKLGLGYIGPDRFYGWIWRPMDKQQVMIDGKNNIIATFHSKARDQFSISVPDESGRVVMFNYDSEIYVPSFLFDHSGSLSVAGISSLYDLRLLDQAGQTVLSIKRDLKPEKIGERERRYFEQDILELAKTKGWPVRVARELVKKLPKTKNCISAVRLSGKHVFVFRFAPDISRKDAPVPVDIFTTQGSFLGTAEIHEIPLFISEKTMYFARSDDSGNIFLVRMDYSLRKLA